MEILNTYSLESNKQIKINFEGDDLSSDTGLLLVKEFAAKIGLVNLVYKTIKTDGNDYLRAKKEADNVIRIIYQIIAAYFEDEEPYQRCKSGFVFSTVSSQSKTQMRIDSVYTHW